MERPLIDTFGRRHRDLRISITDRCNFRCTYCMPEEGMQWLHRNDILSFEEIERLARLLVERHGIESIRLTGGEPTVRAHLPVLVEKLAALPVDLALTTNGATLRLVAHDLAAAGLKRINISLDTFDRDRFIAITRRDELDKVLDGIDAALEAGLAPVKINAVMMRGVNDDELLDFARFGREKGVVVRFIEFMPLDADHAWEPEKVLSGAEILAAINAIHPLEEQPREPSATAKVYNFADGKGKIGLINPVSEPFCSDCNRIRLTAEGKLRTCLFSLHETDLREPLRSGASDDELIQIVRDAVWRKELKHHVGEPGFIQPARTMSAIGG